MQVKFPVSRGIAINMMPVIIGDLPKMVVHYLDMVEACGLAKGRLAYLSIEESYVARGATQRRPGCHTDGTSNTSWGGGGWGGKGIWMASTNGHCAFWKKGVYADNVHGSVERPPEAPHLMQPNTLYRITDRTPHESLPQAESEQRQWFRLVDDAVDLWFAQHSTPSPLGVLPNAKIVTHNKFANL